MDRRLMDAAMTGNVVVLNQLIQDDPLILDATVLFSTETPLHVACMAGHMSFVTEMMKLRPAFGLQLNQDGFTPLHIAATTGNEEIVSELLRVRQDACLVKGKDRRIPLHYAAERGRVGVAEKLLVASRDSVEEVTSRGERALHLAVKSRQFETFKLLVEHLVKFNMEGVLNKMDVLGNTILHIAAARKQYEVVDFLLKEHNVSKGAVELNLQNESGHTALDCLMLFESEAGDIEIREMLVRAGAKRAVENSPLAPSLQADSMNFLTRAKKLYNFFFRNCNKKNSSDRVRADLLVVATLVATATYQAGLSPPGGTWQAVDKAHKAGEAIMGAKHRHQFIIFLICNSMGLYTSLYVIFLLTTGFPLRAELVISVFALGATYITSLPVITPENNLHNRTRYLAVCLPFVLPFLLRPLEKLRLILYEKKKRTTDDPMTTS